MSVLSPEATPDKALRIFAALVRDQEVEGSNPFAPTIFPSRIETSREASEVYAFGSRGRADSYAAERLNPQSDKNSLTCH